MQNRALFLALFFISFFLSGQTLTQDRFIKKEIYIPMRDGVRLFTSIYVPKDAGPDRPYPVLMTRTCYSVAPYGPNEYKKTLTSNPELLKSGYIFVFQDVRGRYMSEGQFTNMTPQISALHRAKTDESTDTYDTIDWLVKNLPGNNGKVGMYGVSYPGFYSAVGALAQHPALVASSPQAPIADFWNDDFRHNGAFVMGYFRTFPTFGVPTPGPTKDKWYQEIPRTSRDGADFYWKLGSLKDAADKYMKGNLFINEIIEHPNYDTFWQKRSLLPHLKKVQPAMLVVGGWFDAEDLHGPLEIYKHLRRQSPQTQTSLVMGPFSHGAWRAEPGRQYHNDIYFGDSLSTDYQRKMETPFFEHYLKGIGPKPEPKVRVFNTGANVWKEYAQWPPASSKQKFYLADSLQLSAGKGNVFHTYLSDPKNPVPSSANREEMNGFTPRNYMSEDQRFATSRPDVLSVYSPVLTEDTDVSGEVFAHLHLQTTGTDADYIVKLIDVYPLDQANDAKKPQVVLANYHQLVRLEIQPARFRNSRESPEALQANRDFWLKVKLQDISHTFKKGHRILVQVQSTAYPLFLRNPQQFVPNPALAGPQQFRTTQHRVYQDSYLELPVLK